MREPDSEVIEALYEGVLDTASFDHALALLSEEFGSVSSLLISIDAAAPAANVMASIGAFCESLDIYVAEFAALDPAPAAFARIPEGTATTTRRMLSPEQLQGAFAQEFYRPLGLIDTLGGNLFADRTRTALIGLHRARGRALFDDDEIAHLERLMPHIRRTLQLRRAFADLGATSAGLAEAVNRLEAGVVLLDHAGRGIFANHAICRIARSGDGLALDRDGHLLPNSVDARRRLGALVEGVRRGRAGGTLTVPRRHGATDYAILVAPWAWPGPGGSAGPPGRRGVLIMVHDPATRPTVPAILKECLGLTDGAARLVAALANDDDLRSYAAREGITIHTARFHLRTALQRTGARTQAELVRLVVRLLRDLGAAADDIGVRK